MKYQQIGEYKIFFDETYFVAYAGGKREIPEKDQKTYNKILTLPFDLKMKELHKFGLAKNPNVIPISGRILLEFIIDGKFVPFFDTFFNETKLLQISDFIVYESMKAKSYDMALGK